LLEVAARRQFGESLLVLFLGSTIGNFDRAAGASFLTRLRHILQPGDVLLLGADLEKPWPQLQLAYDDPLGVTAAFNLNLLARINRELDGDFRLHDFAHEARFNPRVRIESADLTVQFAEGETIWTESSHKYSLDDVWQIAEQAGFYCDAQWVDREWPFAESLLVAR
jgi:L-histidine Nalpha-methyltransferase